MAGRRLEAAPRAHWINPATMNGMASPEVSVVVATGDRHHRTRKCIEAVCNQAGIDDCEVLLLDGSPGDHSGLYTRFPNIRYVHIADRSLVGAERLQGLQLARAPIVAYIEDHSAPRPGWLEAIRRAFARSEKIAVVNYAIARRAESGYVFRALQMMQYGHWMLPARSGMIRYACHQNLAYRRELVTRICRDNDQLFESEFLIHRRLLAEDWTIWFAADAVIDHANYDDLLAGCKGFNALRQVIGAGRANLGRWPPWKRRLWAAGMPLAPLLLLGRLARSVAPRPALWGEFLLALPVMLLAQAWGALYEARGYLRGFEGSRETLLEAERYLERAR